QGPQEHIVVLDQQDLPLHELPPVSTECATGAAGSATRTRVPRPGVLSTLMSPPGRSTVFLTMGNPSPVPEGLGVKKGRKIFSRSSEVIPPAGVADLDDHAL